MAKKPLKSLEDAIEHYENLTRQNCSEILEKTLMEEIVRMRERLANKYLKREERLELEKTLAKLLSTWQRLQNSY